MKLKDFINVLDTEYVILANAEEPNLTGYYKIDEIPEDTLEEELTKVVPVGTIKKTVFDSEAADGDYVAALRIEYNGELPQHEYHRTSEPKRPRFQKSIKIGPIPFDLGQFISDDMFKAFTQSDMFKDLMSPENIQNIIQDPGFMEFMQNMTSRPEEPVEPEDTEEYSDDVDDYEEI